MAHIVNENKRHSCLKRSNVFEKLKVVVSSLYNVQKEKVNKVRLNIQLNPEKVTAALNELVGGKHGIANVLLDENGHLFSSNLSQEANASLICAKKIQHLVRNESKKPIVVVTSLNKSVLILVILTQEFQSIDNSKNNPIIYSFDPWTGKRDLLSLTQHKIFETYLKNGSKDNGLGQIFNPNAQKSLNLNDVKRCEKIEDTAWLSIYYSLMLIYEGNDKFLYDNLAWLNVDIEAVKTILAAHIDCLTRSEAKEKVVRRKKNNDLRKLSQVELELMGLYHERKRHIEEKIVSMNNSSIEEKIKKLVNDETSLMSATKKLIDEISKIENIIKEGESLLSSKQSDKTTQERFHKFITGEEKRTLEMKIEKKSEKSRQNILMHNEDERNRIFEQQVKKLEQDLKIVEENIKKHRSCISDLEQKIVSHEFEMKKQEANVQNYIKELSQLESNSKYYESEEARLKNFQSEINQINVDYNHDGLISRFLENDLECDKSRVNEINYDLSRCTSSIQSLTSSIASLTTSLDSNNAKVSDLRVLIDSRNSSIESLNGDVSSAISKIHDLEVEYESFNGWLTSWWYGSERERVSKSKNEWIEYRDKLRSQIEAHKSDIQKYVSEIASLEAKTNEARNDQINKETELIKNQSDRNELISTLKSLKDQVVKNYMEKIRQVAKQKMENITAIGINRKSENDDKETIARIRKEIERLNQDVERARLSLQISEFSKMEIEQKISETKAKSKNMESICQVVEPAKRKTEKISLENSLIESQIINDEQFKRLMNDRSVCMQINDKFQNWKLLYRASRDGFEADSFHQKCDARSNTLTVIRTESSRIFGGFTGASWGNTGEYQNDPYAFIFSLSNDQSKKQIINCSEEENAIYCDKNYGPCFGNGDIKISNLSNLNEKNESTLGFTYGDDVFEYGSRESKTFLAGSQFFRVDEIEVFCKHYDPLQESELTKFVDVTKKNKKIILQAYETFHTLAVNGMITLNSFINYLVNKIRVFRNDEELNDMKNLFTFIFHHFDADKSGHLEFNEFITCFCIFDTKNKSETPSLFLEFFFDYADKDKSNTLDLDEVNDLLSQFPVVFEKNQQVKKLKRLLLKKKIQVLTKEEFLSVLNENKQKRQSFDESELLDKSLIDSVVFKNNQEFYDLMKLCKFEDQKWRLVYRASRDGFRAEDFHRVCDGQYNSLTVVKAANSNVFGGYASEAWSSYNEKKVDDCSFIFSLINNKNEKNLIKNNEINCTSHLGPCFGSGDLQISSSSNLNSHSKLKLDSVDTEDFQSEEIEVFVKDYKALLQDEINFLGSQFSLETNVLIRNYHHFHAIAINGLMYIDSFIQFISDNSGDADNESVEFLKKIVYYFDQDKTGVFGFSDFLKCLSVFDSDNETFFKFLFDVADKDKNNVLDEQEIREIFSNMPASIFESENALEQAMKALDKNKGILNKDDFLKLIDTIKYDINEEISSGYSNDDDDEDDDLKFNIF